MAAPTITTAAATRTPGEAPPTETRVHVLIPAAGRGARFGTAENKIFARLAGRPVISWTLDAFLSCPEVTTVTVIGREEDADRIHEAVTTLPRSGEIRFCVGGETRQQSVALGVADLERIGTHDDDLVVVHDAARPLVPETLIHRCLADARTHGAAIAAYPLVDTVKLVDPGTLLIERTVPRENLWSAQTPQAAAFRLLRDASLLAQRDGFSATDEASLLEHAGVKPFITQGDPANIKVTSQADLAFAETLIAAASRTSAPRMQKPSVRVGMGYDIHQLVPGRKLILGGVEIPYDRGLLGHSDADVLLHAICDALLGAAGLPDIGHLFPNDDPTYAGADSVGLLRQVVGKLTKSGYAVGNVDACIIAEQPKIGPHSPRMKQNIADALQISDTEISIKATTNEKIGALGAGEGIACHATALIMRIE